METIKRKRGRPRGGGITVDGDGKRTRTYRKWTSMVQRCENEKHPAWGYYGGRGVKVCARWRESYAAFLEDMGEAPEGYWLDRVDNGRGYEPGNCRWVTPKESARNRKQRGPVPGSLPERSREAGLAYYLVYNRIRTGWSEEDALRIPSLGRGHTRREWELGKGN